MIIIDKHKVYRVDPDVVSDEMDQPDQADIAKSIKDVVTKILDEDIHNCISQDEMDIRTQLDRDLGDGELNKLFIQLIKSMWTNISSNNDTSDMALDIEVKDVDYHRDSDEDGMIVNLDIGKTIVCSGCLAIEQEYLMWADTVKRIAKNPMLASVSDVHYMIDNSPSDDLGVFILNDDNNTQIAPTKLLETLIDLSGDDIVPSPVPTHQASDSLN